MLRRMMVAALLAGGTACAAPACDGTWEGSLGATPALLQQLDNHLQCQALVRAEGRFIPAGGDTLTLQRLDWRGDVLSVQLWLRGKR